MVDTIIDAKDMILGRIATVVAKKALLGEKVVVVNAEKAYISGSRAITLGKYYDKTIRGQIRQGPFFYRNPDRFFKRTIRGMLPHKSPRGREAYARIRCYSGMPAVYEGKAQVLEHASIKKLPSLKKISVKELCMQLGGKA